MSARRFAFSGIALAAAASLIVACVNPLGPPASSGQAALTLTVLAGSGGSVAPQGNSTVDSGVPTGVAATPAAGNIFTGWMVTNGSGVSFGNPLSASTTATLTAGSATISATFTTLTLFVTDFGSTSGAGGLSAYSLANGGPAPLPGSPFATGPAGGPIDTAISPEGSYLYVVNGGSTNGTGGLSAYSLSGGTPTPLPGSPYATGPVGAPRQIAISPDGGYLYVTNASSANGTGGLSGYSLSGGVPTPLPGSPYATGSVGQPQVVVISPDGKYLYVTNTNARGPAGLSGYSLSGGIPTPLPGSPFPTGPAGGPYGVTINPDGTYLYVTNAGSTNGTGGLSAYSLSSGVPKPIPGSPFATGPAGRPYDVAISPDGKYLYLTNANSTNGTGGLSAYSLSGGVPTPLPGSPYATGSAGQPQAVAVSPNGMYLYVSNGGSAGGTGGLSAYSLSNGVPTPLPGSPYATSSAGLPYSVVVGP